MQSPGTERLPANFKFDLPGSVVRAVWVSSRFFRPGGEFYHCASWNAPLIASRRRVDLTDPVVKTGTFNLASKIVF